MVTNPRRRRVARPRCEVLSDADGTFGWRLVAANGRPLGVSVTGPGRRAAPDAPGQGRATVLSRGAAPDGPGQNGRTGGYEDEGAAREAFETLVREPKLECEVAHRGEGALWSWVAFDPDGVAVAAAARLYDRRGPCLRSFEQFVETLRTFAPLNP